MALRSWLSQQPGPIQRTSRASVLAVLMELGTGPGELAGHLLDGAGDPLGLVGPVLGLGGVCCGVAQCQLCPLCLLVGLSDGPVDGRDPAQRLLGGCFVVVHTPVKVCKDRRG